MIKHVLVAALLSASVAAVSPAFASSGYGPAPHYNPIAGAPASQRGQSTLTVSIEETYVVATDDIAAQSYGGTADMTSQAGTRISAAAQPSPYAHH
jgi:hypothetical protein